MNGFKHSRSLLLNKARSHYTGRSDRMTATDDSEQSRYGTISVLPSQIPEPNNTTALIGVGVIGVGFLRRRRNLKAADC